MTWLILSLLGYTAGALVFILDKWILDESGASPAVYAFYSTIFLLVVFLGLPFGVGWLHGIDIAIALLSGLGFGFAMWAMFLGVAESEASKINPFIGGVTTIFTFGFATLFVGEHLTPHQLLGMAILALAALFLALIDESGRFVFHPGFLWGILAGLLFAISHTSAKYIYDLYPFVTGLIWTRGAIGFVGLFALVDPSVRALFVRGKKQWWLWSGRGEVKKKETNAAVIVVDKVLGVVGVLLIQWAISLGSVTLVNALVGVQYALMFVLIYLLSRFAPRLFSERFTRLELRYEILAIVLVVVGSGLFVF